MVENWYIETSAINYLCDHIEEHDALATRKLQKSKGRLWLMSPVTFFEMSLTRDEDRRDQVLGFAQHLLHDELIASPEELIVRFIERGCPLIDPNSNLKSTMPLADAWRRVANVSDETFNLSQEVIQQAANALRHIGLITERILTSNSINPRDWSDAEHFQLIIALCKKELPHLRSLDFIPKEIQRPLETLTIFFVFTMLCCFNTLYPVPFISFWKGKNCDDPVSRLRWLIHNLPKIFIRGAFPEMALAAITQFHSKPSRGLIFDMLHFVYLPYVSTFLTTDEHFYSVSEICWHPNAHKIMPIDRIKMNRESLAIEYPQPRFRVE